MTGHKYVAQPSAQGWSRAGGGQQRQATLIWLALFAFLVALLGGSSRFDPIQIAVLRPFAALMLIPALYVAKAGDLRRGSGPGLLLGLMALWIALQLVPLPPSIWATLPDRAAIANIDELVGIGDVWRPLSLAPFRGYNALFSLIVPASALLLALALRANASTLCLLIVVVGMIDATFVMLQGIGGSQGSFHLFGRLTAGRAAGIFANENHSAIFSALVLLVIARLASYHRVGDGPAWLRLAYAPAFVFILLAVLVSGSRAGLVAGLGAIVAAGTMYRMRPQPSVGRGRSKRRSAGKQPQARVIMPVSIVVVVSLVAVFFWLDRAPAFADMLSANAFEDLRWQIRPVLHAMLANHWIVGTGFGSFDAVYKIYEPTALLMPQYVNQAHNDWIQLVIEGGLPAVGLLLGLLAWIAKTLRALSKRKDPVAGLLIFWFAVFGILGAASLVDYPLRTPIFQTVFVWLLLALALDSGDATE